MASPCGLQRHTVRIGLEAPLPGGTLQIGGLEKRVGLFLIETVTSFHPSIPWSGPCFCGDTASLSSFRRLCLRILVLLLLASDLGSANDRLNRPAVL